jgi:hypothetical protein
MSEPHGLRAVTSVRASAARTQGALALVLAESPGGSEGPPHPGTAGAPRRPASLPDPVDAAGALVLAAVEVLAGTRSSSQLLRWTSPQVHGALCARAALATRLRRGSPAGRQAAVRAVRVCRPADGVAEASAVVYDGERVRAVAVRLEAIGGRWRATALEIG